MNKIALLISFVLISSIIGYLYFDKYYVQENLNEWNFITEHSALVVEIQSHKDLLEQVDNSNKSILTKLLSFPISTQSSGAVDSVNNRVGSKIYITFQKIGKDKLGTTYVFSLSGSNVLSDSLLSSMSNKSTSRLYLNENIYKYKEGEIQFHYYLDGKFIVVSTNPLLIEDVIRARNDDGLKLFRTTNEKILEVPKLTNDLGNVYVDLSKSEDLIQIFLKSNVESLIGNIGKESFFDFNQDSEGLVASGFTFVKPNNFLNTFIDQTPREDSFDYFIPLNTVYSSKYLISESELWYNKLLNYWKQNATSYFNERNDFIKKYNINDKELFSLIKNGIASAEVIEGPKIESLLYLSLKDKNQFISKLNSLSENLASINGDSVFTESYGNYDIIELNIKDFPKYLFGPQFNGFVNTYYFTLNDYVILGSSIASIKSLIRNIENEKTWGRQLSYDQFIKTGLQEYNYSYTIDIQRYWSILLDKLNEKWKTEFIESEAFLKQFKLGSIQYSRIDDSFYTNLIIEKRVNNNQVNSESNFSIAQKLIFSSPLQSGPFVVKNHNSNLLEAIVQDSLNNLSLVGADGNKLWSILLDDKITSDIEQVDYYKNGKLQYFLTTKKRIYIIDRLGHLVENFPLNVPFDIVGARVIDYNKSKDYRFLILSASGDIYLYNKNGKSLDGWNPLKIVGEHSFVPFHLRVRGNDFFVTLLKDGTLTLYSRRGELIKGFPIKLKERFETEIFIQIGADMTSTYIHLISKGGKLFKVNMQGLVESKMELFKESKVTKFQIVPDALSNTYLISRNDQYRLVLLDGNENEIFTKDYLGSNGLEVQYYYFSPEDIIYAITDSEQGFTYLYRGNGELINSRPINSAGKIGLLFSESSSEYTVYSISDSTYQQMKFK